MIDRIDHFVLTVASLDATCAFYVTVLGLERVDRDGAPTALRFGQQKINVHEVGRTFEPKASRPTPGAGDFCLITGQPIATWVARFASHDVPIEEGPVARHGAQGPMTSLYVRDPDGNLVEISRYDPPDQSI